jgi:hypothetical protein
MKNEKNKKRRKVIAFLSIFIVLAASLSITIPSEMIDVLFTRKY